jgi:hypothetical protein
MSTDIETPNNITTTTTTNTPANVNTVVTTQVEPKKRNRKTKELSAEELAIKNKQDEENRIKKEEKQKQLEIKKAEKLKEKEEKLEQRMKQKENKYQSLLQQELDKTHGFRVPFSKLIYKDRENKRKLEYCCSLYNIINQLAPDLLKDLSIRTAFNQFVDSLEQCKYINTYQVNQAGLYNWFKKKPVKSTRGDIQRLLNTSYSSNVLQIPNINGAYNLYMAGRVDRNQYDKLDPKIIDDILNIYDKYYILYSMIHPIIEPSIHKKLLMEENARIVAQNKEYVRKAKEGIIAHREQIKSLKKQLKKYDVEGITYDELFGDTSLYV